MINFVTTNLRNADENMSNYYCKQDYEAQGENQQWYKNSNLI